VSDKNNKLKMAQLVEKTGVPKSTILYYIKEGLLPEPERIKQNVCLYDVDYVERIKFIKYLQNTYSKTITELRASVCAHKYDFSQGSDMLIGFLEKLSGTPSNSIKMDIKELSSKTGIGEEFIKALVEKDIVVPLVEDLFDEKDAEMVILYDKLVKIGWEVDFFAKYVELSRELAKFSIQKVLEMKQKIKEDVSLGNESHHMMFEVPLNVQPYIINRLGMQEHKRLLELCETNPKKK
jgi:predicted DNA-binding transcriptional regulator AlpA